MPSARLGYASPRTREVIPMPQKSWSKKRERQYEHIKDGLTERGRDEGTAEEIAARTVNKERARAGEAGRAGARGRPGGTRRAPVTRGRPRAGESEQASRTSTEDLSSSRRGGLRSHS